jgi:hypothetical protein
MKFSLRPVAVWLACAVSLGTVMWVFGHRQMGAFDDNIIIDVAWRMFSGQKPYVDFSLPLSPEFYLGAGWAFTLWGVNWSALVGISIVLAVSIFALQSIALGHFMPSRYAISVALVCQMLAMMQTSYWWYHANASATACLLFSVSMALAVRPTSKTLTVIFCVALTMLSLMKVNIAAVSIFAVVAPLLTIRAARNRVIGGIASSACMVLLVLTASHLNPVDILSAYLKMAGTRGVPSIRYVFDAKPNEIFAALPVLAACVAVFLVALQQIVRVPPEGRAPEHKQVLFIASAGILVGILSMLMTTEQNLISGGPLIFLSSSSLIVWAREKRVTKLEAPVALTFAVFMCVCATPLGLVLFDWLPYDSLVGWLGLWAPYMGFLMAWSFCVAMCAVGCTAAMAGSARRREALEYSSNSLNQQSRLWILAIVVAIVTAASLALRVKAGRLAADFDPLDANRSYYVMLEYLPLVALWAIIAAAGVTVMAVIMIGSSRWRGPARVGRWSLVLVLVIAMSGAAATYVGARRLRVRGNGVELFYSERPGVKVDLQFFRGFSVSPGLKATTNQIATVLSEYRALGYDTSNIFFGIRLEFAYAAFGIPSPKQIAVWWDSTAAYPPSDEPQIVKRFLAHRFPLCVFYGKVPDFSNLPWNIVQDLKRNYRRVSYSEITVFLRNPTP